jgi:hypothetical protein
MPKTLNRKTLSRKTLSRKTLNRKTLSRKTLNRKTLTIKGCAHDPTYYSLLLWYNSSFEKFGSMILEKHNGYSDKVSSYKTDVLRLRDCISKKHSKINAPSKKEDLRIMLDNIEVLIKHMKKDF